MLLLFGHRGAMGEVPENTMLGFEYAYQTVGVRCFEMDVHLTKDGKLAVIHDPQLDRTTNGKGPIGQYTLAELQKLHAEAQFKNKFPDARIPSLDEFLGRYAPLMHELQLEIKTDTHEVLQKVAELVVEALNRFQLKDRTVVSSFDQFALQQVLKISPSQRTSFIASEYTARELDIAVNLGCTNTCIPKTAPQGKALVAAAHQKKLLVTGWLGNTPSEVDKLIEWDVDSITTNFPTSIFSHIRDVWKIQVR